VIVYVEVFRVVSGSLLLSAPAEAVQAIHGVMPPVLFLRPLLPT